MQRSVGNAGFLLWRSWGCRCVRRTRTQVGAFVLGVFQVPTPCSLTPNSLQIGHFDLKPENILVHQEEDDYEPQLFLNDFGGGTYACCF